jgi:hypothetical protein
VPNDPQAIAALRNWLTGGAVTLMDAFIAVPRGADQILQ